MHSLEFSLQKEEAERSARWEQFLKTYCESTVESLDANESPRKEYYHAREKGESKKFETWNEIRPSLYPVARALQHRFKKKKKDVQANNGSVAGQGEIYQSSSQRESEDESDDEFYDVERSDMAQETHSSAGYFTEESNEVSDHEEDPCPWKEELDALVRGGVPMAMRGEVRWLHTDRYWEFNICIEFTLGCLHFAHQKMKLHLYLNALKFLASEF